MTQEKLNIIVSKILTSIDKKAEKMDSYDAVVLLNSLREGIDCVAAPYVETLSDDVQLAKEALSPGSKVGFI